MRKPIIVGLVGLPGAGKTTAAMYLKKKGFTQVTLSDFIRDAVAKAGGNISDRETLQRVGNALREEHGPQVLAQLALKKIRELKKTKVVIDGIRNLYEIAYLAVENHFTLVGITAKSQIRFERLQSRGGSKAPQSLEDFKKHENREEKLGSRETGLRVSECLKKAKYTVKNEKSPAEMFRLLNAIIEMSLHAK